MKIMKQRIGGGNENGDNAHGGENESEKIEMAYRNGALQRESGKAGVISENNNENRK